VNRYISVVSAFCLALILVNLQLTTPINNLELTDSDVTKFSSHAENIHVEVLQSLNSTGSNKINSVFHSDGHTTACGSFNGSIDSFNISATSDDDLFVFGIDGPNEWHLQITGIGDQSCSRVLILDSGYILISGYFSGSITFENDTTISEGYGAFLIIYDHVLGEIVSSHVSDGPGNDRFLGITELSNGNIVAVGQVSGILTNVTDSEHNYDCSSLCGYSGIFDSNLILKKSLYSYGDSSVTLQDVVEVGQTLDFIVIGNYLETLRFNESSIIPRSSQGGSDIFVAKIDAYGKWNHVDCLGGIGFDRPHSIAKYGSQFIVSGYGESSEATQLNTSTGDEYSGGIGGKDNLLIKINSVPIIEDVAIFGTEQNDGAGDLDVMDDGNIITTGYFGSSIQHNGSSYGVTNSSNLFYLKYDFINKNFINLLVSEGNTNSNGRGNGIVAVDEAIIVGGRISAPDTSLAGFSASGFGNSGILVLIQDDSDEDGIIDSVDNCRFVFNTNQIDYDLDDIGDLCDSDKDDDGVNNADDECPVGVLGTGSYDPLADPDQDGCHSTLPSGTGEDTDDDNDGIDDINDGCPSGVIGIGDYQSQNDRDADGCHDNLPPNGGEDNDDDGDNISDDVDACTSSKSIIFSQLWSDYDGDGCHDLEDDDDDKDGIDDDDDDCQYEYGTSTIMRIGCPDNDYDKWPNTLDDCPELFGSSDKATKKGCPDSDGDGWADLIDSFEYENTQWFDSDSDGYGDNQTGYLADSCPHVSGTSNEDRFGCIDSDSDGFSDPTLWWEVEQGADAFVDDITQWSDSDNDGYGDNPNGNYPDTCPNVIGSSNKESIFGCIDSDKDGYDDFSDDFVDDINQWNDSDGDGFGENHHGMIFDSCPTIFGLSSEDRFGCEDSDEDGYSDPDDSWFVVDGADNFVDNITQWSDLDKDGYGDNQNGDQPDSCPSKSGTSSDNEVYGCIDEDNDSIADEFDNCLDDKQNYCWDGIKAGDSTLVKAKGVNIIVAVIICLMLVLKWKAAIIKPE